MGRFTSIGGIGSWMSGHVIVSDTISALMLTGLFHLLSGGIVTDGMLFPYGDIAVSNPPVAAFWTWVYVLPMMFRRSRPEASAVAFVGLSILQILFGPTIILSDCYALIHLYTVIVYDERARSRVFITMAIGMSLVVAGANTVTLSFGPLVVDRSIRSAYVTHPCLNLPDGLDGPECATDLRSNFLGTLAMVLVPILAVIVIAYWQRARRRTVLMLRERNEALRARREEESRIAALAERARIARDMHDVVAHTLSIIIVQADAGRFAGSHDIAVARTTMTTILRESTRALHDMRRLLGIFHEGSPRGDESTRHGDEPEHPGGRPTYGNIAVLLDEARSASPGCRFERTIEGTPEPDELDATGTAVAYRVVQEALSNIRKYAGPDVTVMVDERWDANGLTLDISDDGRGACAAADGHKPGYGLIGMRERLESLNGDFRAGPRIGGGFEVHAAIPFADTSAPTPSTEPAARMVGHDDAGTGHADGHEISGSSGETDAPPRSVNGLRRIMDRCLGTLADALHGRHDGLPTVGAETDMNAIERLSCWSERHYLVIDLLIALALMMALGPTDLWASATQPAWAELLYTIALAVSLTPLVFRRRFPQASAAAFAGICLLWLWVLPGWPPAAPLTVYVLYSVTLYAPNRAMRWVLPVCVAGAVCVGFKALGSANDERTLLTLVSHALTGTPDSPMTLDPLTAALGCTAYAVLTVIVCAGSVAAGQWSKSRDANMLVLQARQEALRAEEEKQKLLAANMERDRISATIQNDVTDTLMGVIGKAEQGIHMLSAEGADRPTPERIGATFEDIAAEGRSALKRMRQLLGVLRETGFSDDARHDDGLALAPAPSLGAQIDDAKTKAGVGDRERRDRKNTLNGADPDDGRKQS